MAPLKVIIVGGGLAGSCLANGLINKSQGDIDVLIRLGAHALTGFRACLTDEQYKDLILCFGRSSGFGASAAPCIFNMRWELLLDMGQIPSYSKSAPIGRGRLRKFLRSPLEEKRLMRYGKKFVRFEIVQSNHGQGESITRVHFDDGSHEDCDVLISAEGSGSRANKQLGLNNIRGVKSVGAGGFLGKCSLPRSTLQTLPAPFLEKGTIVTTTASISMFAAVYLPNTKEKVSVETAVRDAKNASTSTSELGDYDEPQASLMFALNWREGPSPTEAAKIKDKKAYLRQRLTESGADEGYFRLVDVLEEDAIQSYPVRSAQPTSVNWRQELQSKDKSLGSSRVWLIGDSIHPMLPSRGMGANQAIHDTADALGPLLDLARLKAAGNRLKDDDVTAQLAVYEKAMIPCAFDWVKKSDTQMMPSVDSLKGKALIFSLRFVIVFVGTYMKVLKLFGWKPKDDAPELL
ncbi:hypothetical protein COCVIDRAFT_40734 [Bipolaris victoriae FI3]|uniref:FAD-binding domain-containing protein n=1 Tax=Bipolaris victoriae (strain FI3) TaxID=930091 RepID=W7E6A4_BIPV3|nr:hypothetical protein COCVIDRAFT_40734 [Bipolaris victoriae FI3]